MPAHASAAPGAMRTRKQLLHAIAPATNHGCPHPITPAPGQRRRARAKRRRRTIVLATNHESPRQHSARGGAHAQNGVGAPWSWQTVSARHGPSHEPRTPLPDHANTTPEAARPRKTSAARYTPSTGPPKSTPGRASAAQRANDQPGGGAARLRGRPRGEGRRGKGGVEHTGGDEHTSSDERKGGRRRRSP
ncbi:hypothetical protein PLICRDRAFT_180891 [Plicaturopsis crispa FD-325 SS-3]|uniref:Uncharacterized protein n=1 Tax=Plicaturopsis crispa FD-325 SS-3 TaxID=944288 RepID=A0A0C9SPR9_PLICR|nr:hypothetical protein PLICRDRAFT_180891 [Plicaturopsis crispa FD-325 SS-3]